MHKNQKRILQLFDNKDEIGANYVAEKLGMKSTSLSHHHLMQLVKKGDLIKVKGKYYKDKKRTQIEKVIKTIEKRLSIISTKQKKALKKEDHWAQAHLQIEKETTESILKEINAIVS